MMDFNWDEFFKPPQRLWPIRLRQSYIGLRRIGHSRWSAICNSWWMARAVKFDMRQEAKSRQSRAMKYLAGVLGVALCFLVIFAVWGLIEIAFLVDLLSHSKD